MAQYLQKRKNTLRAGAYKTPRKLFHAVAKIKLLRKGFPLGVVNSTDLKKQPIDSNDNTRFEEAVISVINWLDTREIRFKTPNDLSPFYYSLFRQRTDGTNDPESERKLFEVLTAHEVRDNMLAIITGVKTNNVGKTRRAIKQASGRKKEKIERHKLIRKGEFGPRDQAVEHELKCEGKVDNQGDYVLGKDLSTR